MKSTNDQSIMSEGCVTNGPWLATRFWNDIVLLFRSGMPCKRHRIHMKTADRCFSGSEAINWLHKNLTSDPRFVQDITKEKTVLLLQKFLQADVIECVDSRFSDGVLTFKFSSSSKVLVLSLFIELTTSNVTTPYNHPSDSF